MDLYELVVKVIIPLLGAIITYLLIPWLKASTTKEERNNIMELVRIAVLAAEQLNDAGVLEVPKKLHVLDFLQSKGIKIDMQELDMMIEAAVKELNIAQKEFEK